MASRRSGGSPRRSREATSWKPLGLRVQKHRKTCRFAANVARNAAVLAVATRSEAKFQAPVAAESLLLWEDQRGEVPEGMKLLHQMGLPTPKNPGKRKELLAFVVATLRS